MTPEERSLLERIYSLEKENNEFLHSIKRRLRINTAIKILYWVVIIGLSLGAFYFVQPYVDLLKGIGGGGEDKQLNVTNNSNIEFLQDLLK